MTVQSIAAVYRLHVSLDGVEPPIWRRVRVRSDETLAGLHEILQLAMGWTNSHLYVFRAGDTEYGDADPDWDVEDASDIAIHALLRRAGDAVTYIYDMGDEWRHTVRLESVTRENDPDLQVPFCEAGERACPPEDTGGAWRYMNMLEALPDPSHPDHDEWREWIGEFDADAFGIGIVNRLLHRYAQRAKHRRGRGPDRALAASPSIQFGVQAGDSDRDAAGHGPGLAADTIIGAACGFMRTDPFFEQPVFERVIQMVMMYDAAHRDRLDRASKPLGWAAGAIHGAIMTLPGYEDWTLDAASLGNVFGVSAASVQQKSLSLRKHMDQIMARYDARPWR